MKAAPDLHQDSTSALQLNFDQYERYAVVREIVDIYRRIAGVKACRILDVGGFSRRLDSSPFLPIEEFLPDDDCLVYDLQEFSHPKYIRGDGTSWPFRSQGFDLVTTCDTLEHVPPNQRADFLDRIIATARDVVLVSAPFDDPLTNLVEQIYLEFHRKHHFMELPALEEHQRHGLPQLSEVTEAAERQGLAQHTFPSGYLPDWLLMAFLGYTTLNLMGSTEAYLRLQELYNRTFSRHETSTPAYRRVTVIAKAHQGPLLAAVRERFPAVSDRRRLSASLDFVGAPLLLAQLLDLRLSQEKRERLVFAQEGWEGNCGELAGDRVVRRRFVCPGDRLGRVDFLFGTYGRTNSCRVIFRLLSDDQSQELARVAVPATYIEDNRWYSFRFPPISGSARRFFWAEISSPDAAADNAVTVYGNAGGEPHLKAYCVIEQESQPLHVALAERDSALAEKETLLAQREATLAQREATLAQREEELGRLRQLLAAWENAARVLQAELESVRNSSGYRLLSFYRGIVRWLFPARSWRRAPYRVLTAPARWLLARGSRRPQTGDQGEC